MQGVGRIFERYRSGELEDDDEVAITHASEEDDYIPLSEAMVNIRFTLARAARERIIDQATEQLLEHAAKHLHYPKRTYSEVVAKACARGADPKQTAAFRAWVPHGHVDQKRADAEEMLSQMREHQRIGSPPVESRFSFEHTEWWDHARRSAGEFAGDPAGARRSILAERILDEARLNPDSYRVLHRDAVIRSFALDEAQRAAATPNDELIHVVEAAIAERYSIGSENDLNRWCADNDITPARLRRLVREEALVRWVQRTLRDVIGSRLFDCLRLTGDYHALSARARAKAQALDELGWAEAGFEEAGVREEDVLEWFFAERLSKPAPNDLEDFAHSTGFSDIEAFERAALREFLFRTRPESTRRSTSSHSRRRRLMTPSATVTPAAFDLLVQRLAESPAAPIGVRPSTIDTSVRSVTRSSAHPSTR